jgi:hypothetical protein
MADQVAYLLADDFVEFGSSGRVYTKKEVIETLAQESVAQYSLTQFRAIPLATCAILATYCVVRESSTGEQPAESLQSSIWKLIDGRWQLVFHQGTRKQV